MLRADLELIREANAFHRAGTGKAKEVRELVRRDEVYWLERDSATQAQGLLWSELDSLKQAFNRGLFLGLIDFEGHYAAYPAGGFYKRHLDCFQRGNSRMVSIVLYLNQDWQPRDGGRLRVYGPSGRPSDEYVDIDPEGGTLVCFLSRESEHEVLPSHAARMSFTGWFKTAPLL